MCLFLHHTTCEPVLSFHPGVGRETPRWSREQPLPQLPRARLGSSSTEAVGRIWRKKALSRKQAELLDPRGTLELVNHSSAHKGIYSDGAGGRGGEQPLQDGWENPQGKDLSGFNWAGVGVQSTLGTPACSKERFYE